MVADGASVYWNGGWTVVSGTSLSSPIVAARSAVRGEVMKPALIYGSQLNFRDITKGNNGFPCLHGYDLATGRGSLKG